MCLILHGVQKGECCLSLPTSILWAVEGDGWIPFLDSDAEMQWGQEKVVLKAKTL